LEDDGVVDGQLVAGHPVQIAGQAGQVVLETAQANQLVGYALGEGTRRLILDVSKIRNIIILSPFFKKILTTSTNAPLRPPPPLQPQSHWRRAQTF
jgi:hypothetical protein